MAQMHSFSNELPEDWQLFGEVKLLAGTAGNNLHTWFEEMLRPLRLNDRFLSKLLASAELAVFQNTSSEFNTVHDPVHLLIYTPGDGLSSGQSWGFFWIEKKGDPKPDEPHLSHTIEFYLYREGG